jgi:hypothetical protein
MIDPSLATAAHPGRVKKEAEVGIWEAFLALRRVDTRQIFQPSLRISSTPFCTTLVQEIVSTIGGGWAKACDVRPQKVLHFCSTPAGCFWAELAGFERI